MQRFEKALLMAVGLIMKSEMVILSVCQLRSDLYKQGQASRDWVTGGEGQTAFLLWLLVGICVTSLFLPHHEKLIWL